MTDFGFSTRAIHAGQRPDPETGARAMPIYATTSYVFDDAQQAADLFALQTYGNIYTRIGNPTTAAFEERMASLEGGLGGLATASGQSAQMVAVLTLCSQGDHIVAANNLYGGTYTQFDVTLRRLGIDVTFVDPSDADAVDAAFTDRTRIRRPQLAGVLVLARADGAVELLLVPFVAPAFGAFLLPALLALVAPVLSAFVALRLRAAMPAERVVPGVAPL